MSWIDVTDVLSDPMLAGSPFVVTRREETVSEGGIASTTDVTFSAVGSVQPAPPNSLVRQKAFSQGQEAIVVYTTFRLRGESTDGSGNNYEPDTINWRGNNYLVKAVNDYAVYGAGFIKAECISMSMLDTAPE